MIFKIAKIWTNPNVHIKQNEQFHFHNMDKSLIHDIDKKGQSGMKQSGVISFIWNSKQ